MTCDCSKSYNLNLEVKYSFTFVSPEDLKLRLKSIFDSKTIIDGKLKFERVIQDCEGTFKLQSGKICLKDNICSRERDDDSNLLGDDSDIWGALKFCILKEIKGLDKNDIRVSLDFKVTEAVEITYR